MISTSLLLGIATSSDVKSTMSIRATGGSVEQAP
jgi:hypothetical protein